MLVVVAQQAQDHCIHPPDLNAVAEVAVASVGGATGNDPAGEASARAPRVPCVVFHRAAAVAAAAVAAVAAGLHPSLQQHCNPGGVMLHSPYMQTSVVPLLQPQRRVAGSDSASWVPLPSVTPIPPGLLLLVASQRYVAFEERAPRCRRVALQRNYQLRSLAETCRQQHFEH